MPDEKTPKVDAKVEPISGGPTDLAPKEEPKAPPKDEPPIHQGFSGPLKTQEEILSYTKQIEAKLVEAETKLRTQASNPPTLNTISEPQKYTQPVANQGAPKDEDPSLLIYHDPKKYTEKVEERIFKKIEALEAQKAAQTKFWEDMYSENPDLRSIDPIVKSTMTAKWNEIASLPIQEARKVLAKEVRKNVDLIKNQFVARSTEMSSGPVANLGATGEPAPRIPAKPEEPLTFAEQVFELRKSRRK